jgi:lipopolysaccharide export system protein LptA
MKLFLAIIATIVTAAAPVGAHALSTDREKPVVIEADEVEFDFKTGVRTYKGNVVEEQGTLLIRGDKIIVNYDGDRVETATAWGDPAMFQQRPDGKDEDVIGKGKKIILHQIDNTLTLITQASLKQGPDIARGNVILYDIAADKMTIKGARQERKESTGAAGSEAVPSKPGRSRIIIQPRKKPAP